VAIIRRELEPILANVVETGSFVFTAGAIADDLAKDVKGQTQEALADVDRYLSLCGTNKSRILTAVIWVADIRLRDAMNEAWLAWVDPQNLPARACIEAKMADPRCLVEIQFVATKG
jgi:enamine deaminase RidA (YjgF/YER057c/UK114 family)